MPKKILLVVNPISGDRDKSELIRQVKTALTESTELTIYYTTGKNDSSEIKTEFEQINPDRILVAGGDGTIKLIAEALKDKKYSLGILPAGSSNGLATDLQLPTNNMQEAIEIAIGDKTNSIDALRINDQLSLHISDLGVNAELIERYSDTLIRGKFGYALNTIPTLIDSDYPYNFTIEANNETLEVEAIMIAFANSQQFGTGAVINPSGKIDDGVFEVLIFKKLDVFEMLKTLQKEVQLSSDFVEVIRTKNVKVTCSKPVSFQIDGEVCGKMTEVVVDILPKHLTIAVG